MGTIMLELCSQERLIRLMEDKGFSLCQQNGQRTYGGPPPNWGVRPPPPRESEIFIGRLPRMCFEDELIPLFSSIGELYEFRLMLDFSGTNRGFAYAHYATEESAVNAIRILNRYEIRPGHYMGVLRSKNNCRLLVSNIKQDTNPHSFTECIRTLTSDVLNVHIFASFEELKAAEMGLTLEVEEAFQEKITRYAPHSKFAIVEYETHKAAALARRVLIPKLGHIFAIDWAIPLRDKTQFDQCNDYLYEIRSTPRNDFVKARPVPIFNSRRSNLDGILYMTSTFRNIAKYFKFLLNTTLHRCMRKGDIPFAVYAEMEKKIIDRVRNIEHCGQATQLIQNYLAWYSEKRMMVIDPETERILTEVRYFSERMLKIAADRLVSPTETKTEMEAYVTNSLLVHLNFCYYMAIFLSGDERDKFCGLITNSLSRFEGIMEMIRFGNEHLSQFLMKISLLAGEMEEEKRRRGETFIFMQNSRKWKTERSPVSKIPRSVQFSGVCLSPVKARTSLAVTSPECVLTAERDTILRPPSQEVASFHNSEIISVPDFNTVRRELQCPNLLAVSSGVVSPIPQHDQLAVNNSGEAAPPNSPINEDAAGKFNLIRRMETFHGLEDKSMKDGELPVLSPQPSITEFIPYMPKSFYNVVRYYRYLIVANLQKNLENSEIKLSIYNEITTKVVRNITNLETCVRGLGLIIDYLQAKRESQLLSLDDELFAVLRDIQIHATLFVNYVYDRGINGISSSSEIDEFYCQILPNQMSFLYHLAMLLSGEEKMKISANLPDSLRWLNELIEKNMAGDKDLLEFFRQSSQIEGQNVDGSVVAIREIMKDVFDEYNNLMRPYRDFKN